MIRYGTKPTGYGDLWWVFFGFTTWTGLPPFTVNDTYYYKVTIYIWYNNIEIVILSHIHHYGYYSGYPIDL